MMRVGCGFDAHRLVAGRHLVLGGVTIDNDKGLLGHSDADVLTHAVCDALLGAAALGDIGEHFPDNEEKYKDADSISLLMQAVALVHRLGGRVVNVDATVVLQQPKLSPYSRQMRENLAQALGIKINRVGVKATTTENMGFIGREEGASAVAVVLLYLPIDEEDENDD